MWDVAGWLLFHLLFLLLKTKQEYVCNMINKYKEEIKLIEIAKN